MLAISHNIRIQRSIWTQFLTMPFWKENITTSHFHWNTELVWATVYVLLYRCGEMVAHAIFSPNTGWGPGLSWGTLTNSPVTMFQNRYTHFSTSALQHRSQRYILLGQEQKWKSYQCWIMPKWATGMQIFIFSYIFYMLFHCNFLETI